MALRLAMRRSAANSSSLLNRLLRRGDCAPTPVPFAGRVSYFTDSSHTVAVYTQPDDQEFRHCLDEFPLNRGMLGGNMENPFQVTGPRGWYEIRRVDPGLIVRIDMPGISPADVAVSSEYGQLKITGQGRRESPHEDAGRGYSGRIDFPSDLFRENDLQYELRNGVLRVFIPARSV